MGERIKKSAKAARMKPLTPPALDPMHGWVLWSFGQKKIIGAHYSDRPVDNDFLCHGSVPVTMYDNRTTHPDTAKVEAVRKLCLEWDRAPHRGTDVRSFARMLLRILSAAAKGKVK